MADTSLILEKEMQKGKKILFEGAQGCHLDIDHGTFPYVTSSNTVAGNACCGTGVGPLGDRLGGRDLQGLHDAGGGRPFRDGATDEIGESIQNVGQEFGATTGRKRRCGWLDMVLVRQAVRVSGITGIAVTKLDVLTGIEKLKICVGYKNHAGEEFTESVPANLALCRECQPVYQELDGWTEDISHAKLISDLPKNARRYMERLEMLAGVRLSLVSVGAGERKYHRSEKSFQRLNMHFFLTSKGTCFKTASLST